MFNGRKPSILFSASLLLFVVTFLIGSSTQAQETSGIIGTLRDQTGAVIPGVSITVTNRATGLARTAVTTDSGDYSVLNLPVGIYNIAAELTGFKKAIVERVKLDVQHTARVDITLEVGEVTEQVTLVGVAPLLQTAESQVGTLIENRKVVDLPLNGRNFLQLNLLVAGAVEGSQGNTTDGQLRLRGSGQAFSVNGQRSVFNSYLVDGVPVKEVQHSTNAFSPSIDAIQEFRVQTSNYNPEFGAEAGGQINVVTKSGTNEVHGTAYEFHRNDVLDARNFFAPTTPPLRRNQFGGTIGGPVIKDKTFYFGSYEGTRISKGLTQRGRAPDAKLRAGDFSDLLARGIQIRDPLTGGPFAGNIIPRERMSPTTTKILSEFVPPPNNPADPAFNWISLDANRISIDQFILRTDHKFSDTDLLSGRYIFEDMRNQSPKLFPTDSYRQDYRGQNAMVGYTHTFSPTKVNEFKFGFNRFFQNELVGRAGKRNVVGELGMRGFCEEPACWGVPQMNVTGFLGFGEHGLGQFVSGPRGWRNEIYHWNEAFYYTKGSHNLKFGIHINRHRDTFPEAIWPRGIFSFDGRFTSPDSNPNAQTAFADFLLGLPRTSLASIDIFNPYFRNTALYPWFQDDWRVTSNLTLNLGLRYEWFGRPESANDTIATIDYSVRPVRLVAAKEHKQFGFPRALVENDNNNFAPRFGFAWVPPGFKRIVVRGAYGIFYQRELANTWIDIAINPPFIRQTNFILEPAEASSFDLRDPFAKAPPIPLLVFSIARHWRDAYVQQWTSNVQLEAASNLVFQVGYLGNKGTKLPRTYDINQATPGPGPVSARRPFSGFGTINHLDDGGRATYHALQVQAERRFSRGLAFIAAYTFSKSIDDSPGTFVGEGGTRFQDIRNFRAYKALSSQDLRHRFTLSYVYELPFGPGKRYASTFSGVLGHLVGGWQVNGITTFASGQPFTVTMPGDWADVGAGNHHPNLIRNPNLPKSQQTLDRFFDTEAFVAPPRGSFGNAGRNIVLGPGVNNFDFSVIKNINIAEDRRIQFRAEFFNIFNHPNFFPPGVTFGTPTYGKIGAAKEPRDIQFGLKFIF